jgi:hypothetical protein
MSTHLERTEKQIEGIKRELLTLGPMRPGSITRQYRLPKEKKRPFYQISYTHQMRSHTEYVRPENLSELRRETATFRRFRKLIDRWVALALKASKLRFSDHQTKVVT